MIALFLIGFALLAILSGALSYSITLFELLLISFAAFIVYKVIIENKKVFFWFVVLLLLTSLSGGYYLYKVKLLQETYQMVINFLSPFYYSVVVETYYIGRLHQLIMLFAISLLIYILFFNVYYIKKIRLVSPIAGLIAIIVAYMIGTFSGTQDRLAFFLYILTTFIYYYDIYFITIEDLTIRKQRSSFYILACSMASLVILIGLFGNSVLYNPFERKVRVITENAPKIDESLTPNKPNEIKELIYELPQEYEVQSTFSHQGIELFKIKSETLKYFKVQTFSEFNEGIWIDNQKKYISQQQWPIEPILRIDANQEVSKLELTTFVQEEITIQYRNVVTNSLLVAPFTRNIRFDSDTLNLSVEEDGAVIADTMLAKDFSYTLQVIVPKYGTKALSEFLLKVKSDPTYAEVANDVNFNEDDFATMPEGYDNIITLSQEITEGLTNDIDKAQAIETYLRTNYQYSETPEFNEDKDIVSQFLFEKKVGFCQQFASSMVLLLRAQNIPSRFVIGYVAPEIEDDYDEIPEEILYRDQVPRDPYKHVYDSNAHAWVEVYYPSFGWIQFEPTPSQNLVQFSDPLDTSIELSPQEAAKQMSYETRKEITLKVFVVISALMIGFFLIKIIRRYIRHRNNTYLRFLRTYKTIMLYLNALKLGKEDYQTLREYSNFLERKLINSQLKFQDFLAIMENAFYNQLEPSKEDTDRFQLFLSELRVHTRRNTQGHVYNRLRVYEFFLVFKGSSLFQS